MNFGLTGQYNFNDWLGLRANVTYTQKNYRFTRVDLSQMDYLHRNDYLLVPVLASFRFGGANVKGFANAGTIDAAAAEANPNIAFILEPGGFHTDYFLNPDYFSKETSQLIQTTIQAFL